MTKHRNLVNIYNPPKSNTTFSEGIKSKGILDDHAVRQVLQTKEGVTGDHNADGDRPELVNVVYGTDATPPTASTVPIGTLYIQYTA